MNALQDFADHCDRVGLGKRPTVWAQYEHIWGAPCGDMGVPDVSVNDLPNACFALLAPWAIVPTIGSAWLIVDWLIELRVVNVKATLRGIFNPSWSVPYSLSDGGEMAFGEPRPAKMLSAMSPAVAAAKKARLAQTMWAEEYTVESVIPMVADLLDRK